MAKILVVDDELMICDLLRTALSRWGHEVITTTEPLQALELYRRHRPDVTLLDICMPVHDGLEVLQEIRATDPLATVLMLTSADSASMEIEATQLGARDFLRKKSSLTTLVSTVEHAMLHQVAASGARSSEEPPTSDSPARRQGPRVLVVDDEEMVCSLLQQYLTLKGYRVRVAKNGQEALTLVAEEPPQMIILDMYMPGMNGVEVLKELRARQYQGGVVALTASQDERLLQQTLDLGSVDVMAKPVDLERLDLVLQVGIAMREP